MEIMIDLDQNPNNLLKSMNPYPAGAMNAYEISTGVNKPANNYPEILELISESMVLPA